MERRSLLRSRKERVAINLFGQHNLKNIAGALTVCDRIGITEEQFYSAISTFTNVSKRLEQIAENNGKIVYRDFAHSPAKVEATTEATKQKYPHKKVLAAFELHSSDNLNESFLMQYRDTMDAADGTVVFMDARSNEISIDSNTISKAFNRQDMAVFTDGSTFWEYLLGQKKLV